MKLFKTKSGKILQNLPILLFAFLAAALVVRAGNLDSPGAPAATGYTLSDIYARLTTNAEATESDHNFFPSADPVSSLYTLQEIYDAIPTILPETVKLGTDYLGISGALTPDGGTASVADLFSGKTAHLTNDWNLDAGTLNLACDTDTFDGTDNLAPDAYDGSGNGSNRWCITGSGDAAAGYILDGKTAWVDGEEVAGTMTDIGQQTIMPATSNTAITQGYHDETGYCAGDSDLIAANIGANVDIFGVSGTLLKNEYNGSAGNTVLDYAFYTQALGGIDDYNNNKTSGGLGVMPDGSYSSTWTVCNDGNSYCGTSDSTYADRKDDSTKLVWSKWIDAGTSHTWFWANNCYEPGTAENPDGGEGGLPCDASGDNACRCVKKTSSKAGCESIGDGNWRTPYQKELMQAYIDGSWGNLSSAGNNFWSSTTYSNATQNGWTVYLTNGITYNYT